MTKVLVTRENGNWWEITYGFGRLQKLRTLAYKFLPDSIKRAQITKPEITAAEAFKELSPEERLDYQGKILEVSIQTVFSGAHDWDPAKMSADEYIDTAMPEDVGEEIALIIQRAMAVAKPLTDDEKKT